MGRKKVATRPKTLSMQELEALDIHSPEFAAEARRQSRLLARSAGADEDQAFVESLIDWDDLLS
jgi:hypothetical protein